MFNKNNLNKYLMDSHVYLYCTLWRKKLFITNYSYEMRKIYA